MHNLLKLKNLQPEAVFRYFEEICAIPHGSSSTKQISDYLVSFAKEHGLFYIQDKSNNVIIVKEATVGYENSDTVMLQGHMDMVCEKNFDHKHDFDKDGLNLCVVDDYIFAVGTTLGGDDGIALAMILAVFADDTLKHPRLEAVFTVDEEIGMLGAKALDTSVLQARKLINIDSEEEKVLLTSCAGGLRARASVPVRYKEKKGTRYDLVVCGLNGGHSGTEIHKYLGNANIIMGRLLHFLGTALDYSLINLSGGLQDNAIPRESKAEILVRDEDMDHFEGLIRRFEKTIQNEYRANEENISVYCKNQGYTVCSALTPKTRERIVFLLNTIPDGVQKMSMEMTDLVQTSLNLGTIKIHNNEFTLKSAIRSSISSEKYALSAKLRYLTETIGGVYSEEGDYPAWEYQKHSPLREIMKDVFVEQYHMEPIIKGLHAGLECGIFYEKMPGIDMVSICPDVLDIHTTKERLSISSTERTYRFLVSVLEKCK